MGYEEEIIKYPPNTYAYFAEDDFHFFRKVYTAGIKENTMAVIGHEICQKYLKHIISRYAVPKNKGQAWEKEDALHSHSLHKLTKFIKRNTKLCLPEETAFELCCIDNLYFSTRYPGQDSYLASEKDIDNVWAAVQAAREYVMTIHNKKRSVH